MEEEFNRKSKEKITSHSSEDEVGLILLFKRPRLLFQMQLNAEGMLYALVTLSQDKVVIESRTEK